MLRTLEIRHYGPVCDVSETGLYQKMYVGCTLIMLRPFSTRRLFRAERHFLLFKDPLAESGHQKTKENLAPRGKFRLVKNGLNAERFRLFLYNEE